MAIAAKIHQQMEEGSWIRRMFEAGIALKRELGERRVFDLSLGNPVVEPPQEFRRELERLVDNPIPGMHRYMPNAGYPETREEVAHQLRRETGLPFTSQEVVMTCGAGGGLNVVLKTLLNPGDEVMILAPYFPEYISYIDNHGGVPRTVPTDEGFEPDLAALERAITPRTRAVLVNSPNNPTGVVYGSRVLEALGELLQRKEQELGSEIFLVSDEPYRRILYDGLSYPHIYRLHHASLAVTSHSKDLALPGERIGYIAINPQYRGKEELVDGLTFCNRTLGFVNAPALMQWVVRTLQGVTVDIEDYQRKRDLLYQHLTELGYQMVRPQGAFYMFPRSPLEDDVGFVEAMQRYRVLVVPGSGFGAPGHFRIAYCVEDWVIEGALEGFRQAARDLGLT
ncbi:MAG: pyridoxal phosphate-dependent aminotransferase [Dehalococcoidia bacterium]